jgi:hypothetical protein
MLAIQREVPAIKVATMQAARATQEWPLYLDRTSTLANLPKVYTYVVLGQVKKVPGCDKRPLLEKPSSPLRKCMEADRWMLLESAQKALASEKLESLMVEKKAIKCILGKEPTFLMVGGHAKKQLRVACD